METILFKNADIVDPRGNGRIKASLLLSDGVVNRVMSDSELKGYEASADMAATEIIDAESLLILPGLIDSHVHFRDPGFTEKEDIYSGAAAAAAGGFTSVIMMGNTNPPMDMPSRLEEALNKGRECGINIYSCGNVTLGMKGEELTDFEALKEAGAALLSDDGLPIKDETLMESACAKAAETGLVLSLHEEDPAFIDQPGINCGPVAESMGLTGASRRAETQMVKRDIEIAKKTGAALTIQHISALESVELVRQAKAAGVRIYAEATPHHFTLTEEAVRRFGTNAKTNPPLREEADRLAIIDGLKDGTIEMIATDHAPHTSEEKAKPFLEAPSGIIGLETALSLIWKSLVMPGHLSIEQAVMRLTCAYGLYGLPGGNLLAGVPADLVLFDPSSQWFVSEDRLKSKSTNSPFIGEKLPGRVVMTICGGEVVYRAD